MKLLAEEAPGLPSKRRKPDGPPADGAVPRPAIPTLRGGCPLILDGPASSESCTRAEAGKIGFRADNSCPLVQESGPSGNISANSGRISSNGGIDPLLGRPREPLDFRRPPKDAPAFERKSLGCKSLLQNPERGAQVSNEIFLNTHAVRAEPSRTSARNGRFDCCAAEAALSA